MQSVEPEALTPQLVVDALLRGPGAIRVRGLFSGAQIEEARRIVMAHSDDRAQTVNAEP